MGKIIQLALVKLVLSWLLLTVAATREIQRTKPGEKVAAKLQEEGGMMECWNALLELKSCTNEIVLFFFNGESYLGMECCRAIRIITLHCWPSMLTSLGFTAEEGDILRDYCGTSSPEPATDLQRIHV